MLYFFILGKNSILSLAEISSLFDRDQIQYQVSGLSSEVLVFETVKELDPDYLFRQLGGVIKFGIIKTAKFLDWSDLKVDDLINLFFKDQERKIFFGLSLYQLEPRVNLDRASRQIKKLGLEIKARLKERGQPSRLVTERNKIALSSVAVKKNKLLTRGAEIVVLAGQNKIFLGQTLMVQEFEEYSFRDYGRPSRDLLAGTMPPKLAKIMINLAKIKFGDYLLDPFCGSGTIISEALLMGYHNLIGSDLSPQAIEATKKNIEWLRKNFELPGIQNLQDSSFQLLVFDVKDLPQKIKPNSIDAIVTEPFLGPPLKPSVGLKEINQIIPELTKLYLKSFEGFKLLLKTDGAVIIIFPVFKSKEKQLIYLPILEEIKNLGFEIISPVSDQFLGAGLKLGLTGRGSLIYSRPDQRVLREIFVWRKLKS